MTQRVRELPLVQFIRDSRVQPREAINLTAVGEYALAMAKESVYRDAGLPVTPFPPVVAFHERNDQGHDLYWLADGWHRILAAEEAGRSTFAVEIHQGGIFDAVLYAAGANARHGLNRSNRDKRRAVRMLLDHPTVIREEWGNARIGHAASVSDTMVKNMRREREQELGLPPSTERRGQDGKLYSLQLRPREPRQAPPEAPTATENVVTGIATGTAVINGQEVRTVGSDTFMHQCDTEGCNAITTEPSWHCPDCNSHLPTRDYPIGVECPVCSNDPKADPLPILARINDVALPQPSMNGHTTQAPYTPGILKPEAVTLGYERLMAALGLLESLDDLDPADLVAEAPEPDRLLERLRSEGVRLHRLVVALRGGVGVVV